MAVSKHFEPRHISAVVALGAVALMLVGLIVREIDCAANADSGLGSESGGVRTATCYLAAFLGVC